METLSLKGTSPLRQGNQQGSGSDALLRRLWRGGYTPTPRLRRVLALYVDDVAVRFAARTAEEYVDLLRPFLSWLDERGLGAFDVRTGDVEAYQAALFALRQKDGRLYSLGHQTHRLLAVRAFYRFLYRRQLLLHDPAAAIQLPRAEYRLPRAILTRREAARVLAMPDASTPLGLRDRAILETFYATGIRVSELAAVKVEEVDTEDRLLRVTRGKGGKDRTLPLTRAAAEAIERYLMEARPQLAGAFARPELFLGGWGRRLHRGGVALIVRRYATRARVKKPVTCHTFRHTVATHLLKGHADIRHIQALLGHGSLATTERYTRVEVSDLKRVLERSHPRGK